MPRTTIFGVYDGGTYGAAERVADDVPVPAEHQPRQRSWRIVAKRAVLASGAIERGIAFAGNDLPGVMLGSAVRSYLNRFGVAPGARAVVFTASDDGWATARDLAASGVAVAAVVDPRKEGFEKQGAGPWPVFAGAVVKEARGGQQLKSVIVRDDKGVETEIACDLLAVSNGWNPTLHLTCHLGGKPVWQESLAAFVPGRSQRAWTWPAPRQGISPLPRRCGRRAARRGGRERFGLRRFGAAHAAGRRRRLRARHAALVGAWRQG